MKFKPYHKIRRFKDVIKDISHEANYKGKDENDIPIYEESIKPILKFIGSINLHGTNAQVYYTPESGVMAGKRTSGLSPDQLTAHFGFNQFVQVTKKEYFTKLLSNLHTMYCEDGEQIILYGEWAGQRIQKGVGISELPKGFYMFDSKAYNPDTDESKWITTGNSEFIPIGFDEENIYQITEFPTYEIEIDFNNPGLVQNKLIELTTAVELDCPVARQLLGEDCKGKLIGEGIVWKTEWGQLILNENKCELNGNKCSKELTEWFNKNIKYGTHYLQCI